MLTLVIIYKQRLLHENEIVQLLHNYKCYGFDQNRFRRPLQNFAKNVKNNYPKRPVQFYGSFNL